MQYSSNEFSVLDALDQFLELLGSCVQDTHGTGILALVQAPVIK
jgi:hypothetical protein